MCKTKQKKVKYFGERAEELASKYCISWATYYSIVKMPYPCHLQQLKIAPPLVICDPTNSLCEYVLPPSGLWKRKLRTQQPEYMFCAFQARRATSNETCKFDDLPYNSMVEKIR